VKDACEVGARTPSECLFCLKAVRVIAECASAGGHGVVGNAEIGKGVSKRADFVIKIWYGESLQLSKTFRRGEPKS
jgi:hypothetical protein